MESACVYVTSEHRVEVCGAHASNIAKRGAARVVVAQGWASPRMRQQVNMINHWCVFAVLFAALALVGCSHKIGPLDVVGTYVANRGKGGLAHLWFYSLAFIRTRGCPTLRDFRRVGPAPIRPGTVPLVFDSS